MGSFRLDRDLGAIVFDLPNGVPVYVNWTLVLTPAMCLSVQFIRDWKGAAAMLPALTAILLISILLHEIGHMAAAKRQGAETEAILIYGMGGLAQLAFPDERRISLWRIALAGPLVNVALAALFLVAWKLAPDKEIVMTIRGFDPSILHVESFWQKLFKYAFWLNVIVAIVNLLPAFDLDGGVIAQEGLARWLGYERATRIVGYSGLVFACLSTLVLFASILAGAAIWAPPMFEPNLQAIRTPHALRPGSGAMRWFRRE